jgi:hypothetical protein
MITPGPGGDLWFLNKSSIASLTTGGTFTYWEGPTIEHMSALAAGPGSSIWFGLALGGVATFEPFGSS